MTEQTQAPKPAFTVGQIFTASAVMQHRGNYMARPHNTPHTPQQIGVAMGLQNVNDGAASVVSVRVNTNPNDGDSNALYDFAVEVTAMVEGVDREAFPDRQLLEVVATMIFPFMREQVANLTGKGRFGPVWLNPFNIREAVRDAEEVPNKAD